MTIPEQETPEENGVPLLYHISFDRLAELGRSAVEVLAARRPASSPSLLKRNSDLDDPQELVEEIAKYGPEEQDFIRSDMPIQEMVFRILLGLRNEPTPLRDLHRELTERWSTPIRPITITEPGLRRILDTDTYYGFAQEGVAPAQTSS